MSRKSRTRMPESKSSCHKLQGSALYMYLTPKDIIRIRSGAPLDSSERLLGSRFTEVSRRTCAKTTEHELGASPSDE